MNIKFGNTLKQIGKRIVFGAKKHSPEILIGTSIALGAGTVIATWFAARKTDKALAESKEIIKTAKEMPISETYTKKDRSHDIFLGVRKGAAQIIKLYGPAVLMGGSSVYCALKSHRILSDRNAGLVAADAILVKELNNAKDWVRNNCANGQNAEYSLLTDDKLEAVEETIKDENGEEKKQTVLKPKKGYEYSSLGRFFDEGCPAWKKDTQYNLHTLRNLEAQMTDKLRANHVLTLNEVYEELGFEKTQAGFENGWVCQPGHEHEVYVSFGNWLHDDSKVREMIFNGERYYFLDFNCDKIIWSQTPFRRE